MATQGSHCEQSQEVELTVKSEGHFKCSPLRASQHLAVQPEHQVHHLEDYNLCKLKYVLAETHTCTHT